MKPITLGKGIQKRSNISENCGPISLFGSKIPSSTFGSRYSKMNQVKFVEARF